jgi:hypothetical protein
LYQKGLQLTETPFFVKQYTMKKNILTLAALLGFTAIYAQKVPITFEPNENGADWTWTVFENNDNPPLEIVENPSKTGINTSNTVAKLTARVSGAPWVGCESKHGSDIGTFQLTAATSTITIMVYKTVISDVGIKLVTSSNAALPEVKVANTKINEWEELSFDFSGQMTMVYDQIVIFPDFRSRGDETVSYFDNLTMGNKTIGIREQKMVNAQIFPNPANDYIQIKLNTPSQETTEVTIINALGKVVKTEYINSVNSNKQISTSDLSRGVYFVKLKNANSTLSEQVILH